MNLLTDEHRPLTWINWKWIIYVLWNHYSPSLPVLIDLFDFQGCSKWVDNVQGPHSKWYHWFGSPSLFLVHGPLRVTLRLCWHYSFNVLRCCHTLWKIKLHHDCKFCDKTYVCDWTNWNLYHVITGLFVQICCVAVQNILYFAMVFETIPLNIFIDYKHMIYIDCIIYSLVYWECYEL